MFSMDREPIRLEAWPSTLKQVVIGSAGSPKCPAMKTEIIPSPSNGAAPLAGYLAFSDI